ncbi:MAG: cytochrome c peroxidase, partial [Bacteroidota bacterium]
MNFRAPIFILAAILTLASCQKDPDSNDVLDADLLNAVTANSGGEGVAAFILPASEDFANIPQDPLNPITAEKVELGRFLFHETHLATGNKYEEGKHSFSCASCHHAAGGFQANRVQGIGDGGIGFGQAGEGRTPNPLYSLDSLDVQPIRTPTALNAAYQQVHLWNGQFGATGMNTGTESQWTAGTPKAVNALGFEGVETQAIAGLTVHRIIIDQDYITSTEYKALFDAAFGYLAPNERYTTTTAGLAIAAYERTILANQSPWQSYLRGNLAALTDAEKRGAILFFTKGECASCHTGPALNSMSFHALGMDDLDGPGVYGSVDVATEKGRGGFTGKEEDNFKFKTPTLYNLINSPFYGHGGTFRSVKEVIEYKNEAIPSNPLVPLAQLADDFRPLGLTETEIEDMTLFIES